MRMYSIPENLLTPEQKEWVTQREAMIQKRAECLRTNDWPSRWVCIMGISFILAMSITVLSPTTQSMVALFAFAIATFVVCVLGIIYESLRKDKFGKKFPEWAQFMDKYKGYI